jgi:hypothetical protein
MQNTEKWITDLYKSLQRKRTKKLLKSLKPKYKFGKNGDSVKYPYSSPYKEIGYKSSRAVYRRKKLMNNPAYLTRKEVEKIKKLKFNKKIKSKFIVDDFFEKRKEI